MADIKYWEQRFVKCFIRKEKRGRYIEFLTGQKHRQKILERLNHSLDYELTLARQLHSESKTVADLLEFLRAHNVSDSCHLMADDKELDSVEMGLENGVEGLFYNSWGVVLICPPKPIAVYKEEAPGRVFLLAKETG